MEISRGTEGCGEAWLPRSYLPFGTLETLHRLSISIPLGSHSPMETLGPVLLEHLPLRVAVSFYRDATAYWSDLIGAHLSEDFEQVGQLDRLVHQAVIASLAALRGETGTGVKWLQKRVQRAGLLDNPSWRAAMAPSSPRDGRESLDAIGRVHLALGRNAAELAGGRDLPDPPPGLDALSRREVDPDGQWYECSLFNGRRLLKP